MTDAEHVCACGEENGRLRARITELEARIVELEHELGLHKRRLFGTNSEKMTTIDQELRRKGRRAPDRAATLARRRARAAARQSLERQHFTHPVSAAQRCCPKCGRTELRKVGAGRLTTVYELVPARLIAEEHVQETLACPCGEYVVTAEGPAKAFEQGHYGPGFMAHLAVAKCGDSIPLYRLEKGYDRIGLPVARSTMTDLFHRTAELTSPLSDRLLQIIASQSIVHADETPVPVMAPGKCRKGFLWTFIADKLIAYVFSPTRSGETPSRVLGGTKGTLVVDAYTGYNDVTSVDGRERAGCNAHVRRKFFDALPTAPEAMDALDMIVDLYVVEHEARELGIVRTAEHLLLRQEKSAPIMDRFHVWLEEQQPRHLPRGPMGRAISYALNNWVQITRFLRDARISLDNNISEAALRVAALGRKNFLFVGHDQAGRNIAGLYSLIATCEARDINPFEYLKDVLLRLQTHPASRIDELLPQNWRPLPRAGSG